MAAPRLEAPRDTVPRRLRRLVTTVLLLLIFVGLAGVVAVVISTGQVVKLAKGYAPAGDANAAALQYMLDAETAIRGYTLTGDPSFLQPYRAGAGKVVPALDKVAQSLAAVSDHRLDKAIARERGVAEQWLRTFAEPVAASAKPVVSAPNERAGKSLFDKFRSANEDVGNAVRSKRSYLRDTSLDLRNVALPTIIATTLATVVLGALLSIRTGRQLTRPITGLWAAVRRMDDGELDARADEADGPAEVRAVAAAMNAFAASAQRAADEERRADELRALVRPISAAIRGSSEPVPMVQSAVVELAAAFEVDRVWLHTFDDDRVPQLSVQSHRPDLEPVPAATEHDAGLIRTIADRLWRSAAVLVLDDQETAQPEGFTDLHAENPTQARASIISAMGDGQDAFGVVWLAMAEEPRSWTASEVQIVQRVTSELSASLMQANIMVRQREAVEQLHELDAAKSAFVSTVSHELRTPLTSIGGYVEMVLDGAGGDIPEPAADMLRVVERNAAKLQTLIEDLLMQSRIDAGRLHVNVTRVDLGSVLTSVHTTMAPLADAAGVSFAVHGVGAGPWTVDGDPRQLEQAVTNLVANAIKFTPGGGSVTVSIGQNGAGDGAGGDGADGDGDDGDDVCIRIADTGIGIPADELPRLYDRFFRASNVTDAAIQGTGLGMSITMEIVRGHQGSLEVDSTLGVGTTFLLRLPLA